ncbi:MAG: transporter substrate-binding domain-containing protein [Eubacterium sp.]|nr:transporter substrate-binding domain-containing protein [Eubacterium sp.]
MNRKFYRIDVYAALILSLVVVLAAALMPVSAFADSNDTKTVRVGYYENEVFQEGAKEGAVKTGYAYEYYQKMSEYTGWKYEYVYGEFGDLYQMLLDGEIDLLAGLAKREDRLKLIGYPDEAMGHEIYSLVKHDDDDDITIDTSTLKGKKIGVLDSAMADTLDDFLKEHDVKAEKVLYKDYEPLFEAFDNREIDVLAAEGDGAYGRAHAEMVCSFGASDYYLCVNKARKDLIAELNTAQAALALNEPNYINTLRSSYYSSTISSRSFSDAEKEWIKNHNALKVGYLNNYLPYSDTDESGKATGLISDIIPKILKELGIGDITVEFEGFDSYDKMIGALGEGAIDMAFPVGGGLYYSEENGIFQSTPVVSADTELVHAGDYSEDTIKHFAVNENNRMQYYFVLTHFPDAEITFYPSIDDCLKAVSNGEVGCTTLNGLRANDILRNSSYKGLSLLQTTHSDDRCFGVQIGNAGLLMLLNRGINVVGTDYAQNLAFHYTDQLYSYSAVDVIRDNLPLLVGIILAIAALIILILIHDRRQDKMITALASDYRSVYHVDLDKNDAVCYRADSGDKEQTPKGKHFRYLERFTWYAENKVAEDYREGFLEFIDPDNVRKALADNAIIAYRYLVHRNGKEYYEMIRMAGVRHPDDRKDHIVHAVGLGLTVIDEEMRDTLAKNQALKEALDEAQQASKAKTAFLSNMSHEIRTPMNAIIGLDTIALSDPDISDETRDRLEKIDSSAHHLLGLINDILDISRIESGKLTLKDEEFSLRQIIEQVNTLISAEAQDKGLTYECDIRGDIGEYYSGDDLKLKQVLINILGNAVKFTDAGGSVRFIVEKTRAFDNKTSFRFTMRDTGAGMDESFIPEMFQPFTQENSGAANRYGSTGLGMAISKSIVEMMDGTIDVKSKKGEGTTFIVQVTLLDSDRKSEKQPDEKATSGFVIEDDQLAGRHVLIAEDMAVNAEIIKELLNMKGIESDHAENGRICVDMFSKNPEGYYDAILMDMRMPEMDGLEATKGIRAMDRKDAKRIPIIALTANAFDEDIKQSLQAGMNAHLSKPVEPEHLYQTLGELISRSENDE